MRLAKYAKAVLAVVMLAGATPAFADLAADKATVDAAKAAGTVGEQGDGFLGIVGGSADPAQTAGKSGVTAAAAGQATGAQLIAKTPSGQYIKPLGGNWTKK